MPLASSISALTAIAGQTALDPKPQRVRPDDRRGGGRHGSGFADESTEIE